MLTDVLTGSDIYIYIDIYIYRCLESSDLVSQGVGRRVGERLNG